MRRPDQNHATDCGDTTHPAVNGARDATRIHIAGVRRDKRFRHPVGGWEPGHQVIDLGAQLWRARGVEHPGHRRFTDIHRADLHRLGPSILGVL